MECILLKTLSDSAMQYYKVLQFIFTLLKVRLLSNNQFLTRKIANDHLVHVSNLDKQQFLPPLFIILSNNLFLDRTTWRMQCTLHQSWHFPSQDLNCNLVRLLFLLHKSESALLGYLSYQFSTYHTCAKMIIPILKLEMLPNQKFSFCFAD